MKLHGEVLTQHVHSPGFSPQGGKYLPKDLGLLTGPG